MNNRPSLLSQGMVDRALADNAFYAQLPEFTQLRGSVTTTVKVNNGNCSRCGRTKQKLNTFNNFSTLSTALTQDGRDRLKRYFGVTGLMLNIIDPNSKQVTVKIL